MGSVDPSTVKFRIYNHFNELIYTKSYESSFNSSTVFYEKCIDCRDPLEFVPVEADITNDE